LNRMIGICIVSVIFVFAVSGVSYAKVPQGTAIEKYFINLDGWNSEPAYSNTDGDRLFGVDRGYRKGDKIITASLRFGISPGGFSVDPIPKYQLYESKDGCLKTITVSGHRVDIHYITNINNSGNSQCIILVFLNTKDKTTLVFECMNLPYKEALEIAKKFSWTGIEGEFK
jgi:hypothetical protein